jgi:hypothetical protein
MPLNVLDYLGAAIGVAIGALIAWRRHATARAERAVLRRQDRR